MPAISLNQASQQLHKALDDYTAAHDAATADERISDRLMLEVVMATLQRAREVYPDELGIKLLDSAERHLRAVLGMEDAS